MVETGHARDAGNGFPSTHSTATRMPTAEMLKDVDTLVVDLQDVGLRIYTFIYTMANCLRAGKEHGVPSSSATGRTQRGKIGPMLAKVTNRSSDSFPFRCAMA